MIARLEGRLAARTPGEIVIDVGGVGYQTFVSLQTFAHLPALGETVALVVYTHVREDALQLFGFRSEGERALFLNLKEVSGIGPRLALNILSGVPAEELETALREGDVARLVAIPGVGRKTAERMIVELREKVGRLAAASSAPPAAELPSRDAVSALVNLGYRAPEAERAVRQAASSGAKSFDEIVREALRSLAS